MHVAIAGGGIFGQVIAWRLAARGARATVIEPVGPGGAGSASGDRTRLVRAVSGPRCFAESGHVSLDLWARWSAELGEPLIERTGVVYLERAGDSPEAVEFRRWLTDGVTHVRALGAEAEELDPAEASRRWPALSAEGLSRVVFEPAGGFGRAALATRAVARAGLATGRVDHVPGAAARVVLRGDGGAAAGLTVSLAGGETRVVEADAVVIAAGAAGVELVRPLLGGGDLGIRRVPHWTSYWDVPYPAGAALHKSRLPSWAELGALMYGFPDDGESGFKMAWHEPSRAGAGHADDPPGEADLEALREAAMIRFPALRGARYRGHYQCAYDATPDEMFQIGPVPGVSGLFFVGGLSGHGFKHAPAIGDSVAAILCGEEPMLDLGTYALRIDGASGVSPS